MQDSPFEHKQTRDKQDARYFLSLSLVLVTYSRLGIRGTQVKSSIQDIVDEVAPIKRAPL
jgi:hypothetical protein